MKKMLSLVLSLLIVFSLTACGKTEAPQPTAVAMAEAAARRTADFPALT